VYVQQPVPVVYQQQQPTRRDDGCIKAW
jgi:hypothetical protein